MMDWNGNGKTDGFDHFVTYEIVNNENKQANGRRKHSGSGLLWFAIVTCVIGAIFPALGILLGLGLIWYMLIS